MIILAVPLTFSTLTPGSGRVKELIHHLAVCAGLIVILGYAAWAGDVRIRMRMLHLAVAGSLVVAVMSLLVTEFPFATRKEIWRVFMLAGTYVMAVFGLRSRRSFGAASVVIGGVMLLVCAYGIAQRLGHDIVRYEYDAARRVPSSMGNPNMLACFLLMMIWLLVGVLLDARTVLHRVFLSALILAGVCVLVFTLTRGAWFAFALSVVLFAIWAFIGKRFPFPIARRRKLLVGGTSLVLLVLAGLALHRPIADRIGDLWSGGALSDSAHARLTIWKGAARLARAHPIMGTGAGTFELTYPLERPADFRSRSLGDNIIHAHSEPLQIASETGAVGLVAFLALLIAFYAGAARFFSDSEARPLTGLMVGIVMAVTAVLIENAVDVGLRWTVASSFLWLSFGMSVAIRDLADESATAGSAIRLKFPSGRAWRVLGWVLFSALIGFAAVQHAWQPFISQIHLRRALDLRAAHRSDEAIVEAGRAVHQDPFNLLAHYLAALSHLDRGEDAAALKACLHLDALAPNYMQLEYTLGFVYGRLGRWDEAVPHLLKAEEDGTAPDGFSTFDYLRRQLAGPADRTDYETALRALTALRPDDAAVWDELGLIHLGKGNDAEAERCFDKALKAAPTCIAAMDHLAGLCFRTKDYARTAALCREILRLKPDAHHIRLNLGRALYLAGNRERAIEVWQELLDNVPGHVEARACLEQVMKE